MHGTKRHHEGEPDIGTKAAKNGAQDTSSGLGDLASEVLRQVRKQRKPFDMLQLIVVHPTDDGNSAERENNDDYFIRYFSFDDAIWNGEHGWIHDGIDEVGPGRPLARHMRLNLRVSGYKYFPDEEPFSAPVEWDGEDEGDAYDWANFVRDAYRRKDAQNKYLQDVCSTVTHVLTVNNITRSMEPMT